MSGLSLTLSCGLYELTRPLVDGEVVPDGIDLTVDTSEPNRIYSLRRRDECDVAEFNLTEYFRAREAGHPITALPIFPHRRFRHGYVFVDTRKDIRAPRDLVGRRVGVFGNAPAAAVWVRGLLQDRHGVPLDEVDWVEAPLEPMPPDAAPRAAAPKPDEQMLFDGEFDALVSPGIPESFTRHDSRITRLFPDYKQLDIAYYREAGIFPIMHAVTIGRDLIEREPWVVGSLIRAFDEAKRLAYRRVSNPRLTPLAFFESAWEEQQELLGQDPWEYGMTAANRRNLATALRYTREQRRIVSQLDLDDLFTEG